MIERKSKTNALATYILGFILIVILVGGLVLLVPVYQNYKKKQAKLQKISEEHKRLQNKTAELNSEVAGLKNNPKSIEKVAREKFELVKDGEYILKYDIPEKK